MRDILEGALFGISVAPMVIALIDFVTGIRDKAGKRK